MKDPRWKEDFFERVFQVVREIPPGRATSYGAIANYLGSGSSARTVGWAMNAAHGKTPVIPAHRVVNRNGQLTGKFHFPGPDAMQHALEAEGLKVVDDTIVGFKEVFWDPAIELAL